MEKVISVVIFEDQQKIRDSLVFLLQSAANAVQGSTLRLAGAFPDCRRLRADLERTRPNVILMDIDMPPYMNGVEATAIIRAEFPESLVIMYTQHDDSDYVFRALQNGAKGYLLKSSPFQEVVDSIAVVHNGGSMMSPSISRKIADFFTRNPVPFQKQHDYGLSDREQDVLRSLAEGHSYKKIGSDLFIAVDTVRSHIRKIYEKLEVHSKSEAVKKAFEERLV